MRETRQVRRATIVKRQREPLVLEQQLGMPFDDAAQQVPARIQCSRRYSMPRHDAVRLTGARDRADQRLANVVSETADPRRLSNVP